jgi:hypothetical protein
VVQKQRPQWTLAAAVFSAAVLAALSPGRITAQQGTPLEFAAAHTPASEAAACAGLPVRSEAGAAGLARQPLIVIGFMGGRVRANNFAHGEARLARDLNQRYPGAVHAVTFANRDERDALRTVLELLDSSKDGNPTEEDKSAARIVLFGHSWGASEAIRFARELDRRGIPVLLTIQVDSVAKSGEDDGTIPANVREAINFYQSEGLLHGRRSIQAMDPARTTILGSYESSYKSNPVSCAGYGWFARAFMKPHIEIENDSAVWNRIEALIVARSSRSRLGSIDTVCNGK